MPDRTPPNVAQRVSELGADVILCGDTIVDAVNYAEKVQSPSGPVYLK